MAYKIIVSPRAQREIENAIDYYSLYSVEAPQTFITLLECLPTLQRRDLKIKKFPYSLYFVIQETSKTVRILSCFHHKLNPDKRPKV
jgi:plasmid stabilization system protein ParE